MKYLKFILKDIVNGIIYTIVGSLTFLMIISAINVLLVLARLLDNLVLSNHMFNGFRILDYLSFVLMVLSLSYFIIYGLYKVIMSYIKSLRKRVNNELG